MTKTKSKNLNTLTRADKVSAVLYSLVFSAALLFGFHVQIDDRERAILDSYRAFFAGRFSCDLKPLSFADLFLYLFIFALTLLLIWGIFTLGNYFGKKYGSSCFDANARISFKQILMFAAILLVCWLPMFLRVFPGIIYIDTLQCIEQGLSSEQINAHPLVYSHILAFFYSVGVRLGVPIIGLSFYTLFQMVLMALLLSYECCWISARGNVRAEWALLLALFLGLNKMIAAYAVSIWKDPPFAVLFIFFTLYCMDLVLDRGENKISRAKLLGLGFSLVAICFLRLNGITTLFCLTIAFFVWGKSHKNSSHPFASFKVSLVALVFVSMIQGPIYSILGVTTNAEELYGNLLNQIARVFIDEGVIPENDDAYFSNILKPRRLSRHYYPLSSDPLKFFMNIDWSKIGPEFYGHYLSVAIRNPRSIATAFLLQTHGHWAPWASSTAGWDYAIECGSPYSLYVGTADYRDEVEGWVDRLNVRPHDLLDRDPAWEYSSATRWKGWQKITSPNPARLLWFLLLLLLLFRFNKRRAWTLALIPCLSNIIPVALGVPIWYLPRYSFSAILCLPFFVLMFVRIFSDPNTKQRT